MAIARILVIVTVCARGVAAQAPNLPGWQLKWHDEFDGASINTNNWRLIDLQNSHNNEKQFYRPEQALIVDGKLRITATKQPLGDKQYRSARLESVQTYAPGRFEARIDLPTTQGTWPAFWLLPNGVQWPTGGEIDIIENRGSQPLMVSSAYHWQTKPGPCCAQHQFVVHEYSASQNGTPVNFHTGFHLYAVEWEAKQLRFYVDGTLHFTVDEAADRPIFEAPMNIILNLAVGGDFGGDPDNKTVFPQHMDIDYVRVWQKQTGLSGDFNRDGRVNAANYVVWRESKQRGGIDLPANGSGNGTVDDADYFIWRNNVAASAAMGNAASVPEAAPIVLSAATFIHAVTQRAVRP